MGNGGSDGIGGRVDPGHKRPAQGQTFGHETTGTAKVEDACTLPIHEPIKVL